MAPNKMEDHYEDIPELPNLNRNASGGHNPEPMVLEFDMRGREVTEHVQRKRESLHSRFTQKINSRRKNKEWLEELIREKQRQERLKKRQKEISLNLPFHELDLTVRECPICMSETFVQDKLSCGDSYCSSCIKLLLKDYLDTGRVYPEELCCPVCDLKFGEEDIKTYLGPAEFQRMLDLRQKFKVQKLVSSGLAKFCPIPECLGYINVINGVVAVACVLCRATVCPICMKCSHPTLTCEEFAQNSYEDELNELMMSKNWKRCAFCSAMVEKINGCNFVRCRSNICKNHDRAICYLCGKGLNEKHHHKHYKINGPYGKTCNTLDGVEDDALNEES